MTSGTHSTHIPAHPTYPAPVSRPPIRLFPSGTQAQSLFLVHNVRIHPQQFQTTKNKSPPHQQRHIPRSPRTIPQLKSIGQVGRNDAGLRRRELSSLSFAFRDLGKRPLQTATRITMPSIPPAHTHTPTHTFTHTHTPTGGDTGTDMGKGTHVSA